MDEETKKYLEFIRTCLESAESKSPNEMNGAEEIYNRLGLHVRALFEIIESQSQKLEAMTWRPIASAPMDGTDILLFSDDGVYQAKWIKNRLCAYWVALSLPEHGCGCCGHNNASPTHWMPLPNAPKATLTEEGEG